MVRTLLPLHEAQNQSLVGELRSIKPCGAAKKEKKPFKNDFQPQQTSRKPLKIPMLRPYPPEICQLTGRGKS